jgi:hypothetical protein
VSNGYDVWVYDLATGTIDWVDNQPYDQMADDADGHLIVYSDTERLNANFWAIGGIGYVEIQDLQTKETREITMQADHFGSMGLSGKYLAMMKSSGMLRSLYICDLEAGGFIDSSGHVIPHGAVPDGGVGDAGTDSGV